MERTPREIVGLYKEILDEVVKQVPPDVFGKTRLLTAEDYRTMAASCMIAYNDQFKFKGKGGGGNKGGYNKGNGNGNYDGPSSEAQQKYIATLMVKGGEDAVALVDGYLDANGVEKVDKLTKSLATTLISQLKELVG